MEVLHLKEKDGDNGVKGASWGCLIINQDYQDKETVRAAVLGYLISLKPVVDCNYKDIVHVTN